MTPSLGLREWVRALGHPRLRVRLAAAFAGFVVLLLASYGLAAALLPPGALRAFPSPALGLPDARPRAAQVARTWAYNLFALAVVVAASHWRVGPFSFGYLPVYANTVLLGLFAGSDSFAGGVSARTWAGWWQFLGVGGLEFAAYLLAAAATARLAVFHADRWRGESFRRVRPWWPPRLTRAEALALGLAVLLLALAAAREWPAPPG